MRERAEALERARDRRKRHGIKVEVDDDLRKEEAFAGVTLLSAEEQLSIQGTVDRADNLLEKLKKMAGDVGGKTRDTIDKIMHIISQFILRLREWACKTGKQAENLGQVAISKAGKSAHEVQQSALEFGGAMKGGVEKLTQKFKS